MTVFYLDILSGLGESPIYIKPGITHYVQNLSYESTVENYVFPSIVCVPEQITPIDSHLSQLCNIY